jgi:hypothetical protein
MYFAVSMLMGGGLNAGNGQSFANESPKIIHATVYATLRAWAYAKSAERHFDGTHRHKLIRTKPLTVPPR